MIEILERQHMGRPGDSSTGKQDAAESGKTKGGREKVAHMINDWGNSQARMPASPHYRFDFNWLRRELGLEEE